MQDWLKGFELAATTTIRSLLVTKREQVREYFSALWLWHRLENKRWDNSKITLRDNIRGKPKLEVDHIASVKLLEDRFAGATTLELEPIGGKEAIPALMNSIGNCFLMEKTFNISKLKKPLSEFLTQIHDFSTDKNKEKEWTAALSLSEPLLLPDVADFKELSDKIKERETIVKNDLVNFINGSVTRVDIK